MSSKMLRGSSSTYPHPSAPPRSSGERDATDLPASDEGKSECFPARRIARASLGSDSSDPKGVSPFLARIATSATAEGRHPSSVASRATF